MEIKIIATNGEWFVNKGQHTFVDPSNGTRFDPGVYTKAEATDWVKGQPVLASAEDPTAEPQEAEVQKPVVAPSKNTPQ